MTYDDQCHGSTTLYAVLNFLNDSVISQIQARHRHIEWLKFLKQSDANVAPDMRIHVLLDNYATHKLPTALKWLAKHQRFPSRFTAASASWMNMMARFFKNLSEDRLKRTVFKAASTAACETHLRDANPRQLLVLCRADARRGRTEQANRHDHSSVFDMAMAAQGRVGLGHGHLLLLFNTFMADWAPPWRTPVLARMLPRCGGRAHVFGRPYGPSRPRRTGY